MSSSAFGEPISSLKQDIKENPEQQGNLELLYNVFDALKPNTSQSSKSVESFQTEAKPFPTTASAFPTSDSLPMTDPMSPLSESEYFADETTTPTSSSSSVECPVCKDSNANYKPLKKTLLITVLFMFMKTKYFQTLCEKFVQDTKVQHVVTAIIFAGVSLLIIRLGDDYL